MKIASDNNLPAWEESLPLPEESQAFAASLTQQTESAQPEKTVIAGPTTKFKFFSGIWNKKVLVTFLLSFFTAVGLFFVFTFAQNKVAQPKTGDIFTQKPAATVFRRLSSAFIPKIPSMEPTNLSQNWGKAEDINAGFSLLHPEEWQAGQGEGGAILTLYYPVVDESAENFGKTVVGKLSVLSINSENFAGIGLEEFLQQRYNSFNVSIQKEADGQVTRFSFKFDKTFVSAVNSAGKLFILEGKVAKAEDFDNFLPIFGEITQTFKIL